MITRLLKCFAELQHRGCTQSALGNALQHALSMPSAASVAAAAAAAPPKPPGIFFHGADGADVIDEEAPATTACAQPASAAPSYAAPPTSEQPINDSKDMIPVPLRATRVGDDILNFKGGVTVPLRATSPSIKVELYHTFKEEIDYVDWCVSKGTKPRTQNEQQRLAKAVSAIEILNLLRSLDSANG